MSIQQMLLGVGAVATKTYVDDVFSTFLYKGNSTGSSSQSINNGINLSGEGGMTWIKYRDGTYSHSLFDTVRGNTKRLSSNGSGDQDTWTDGITSFNNNGFTLGSSAQVNYDDLDYASWTFRKSPAFTICSWTGNGVAGRQISHDLGSRPGMVAIKCTSDAHNWTVWHRGLSSNAKTLTLNDNAAEFTADDFNGAAPSSTVIHLSSTANSNGNGKTYVAYVFAGGESTAATARSVDFDGSDDRLMFGASSDFSFGTGDFTVEGWFKQDGTSSSSVISLGSHGTSSDKMTSWDLMWDNSGEIVFYGSDAYRITSAPANSSPKGQWHHFALVRHSGVCKLYYNGNLAGSYTSSEQWGAGNSNIITIGGIIFDGSYSQHWNGKISNIRIVKGTAVYTSSFKPPTEPLTNITNTVLLCCNNSSVTGGTVLPVTPTTNSSPTASTDSPFDDPAGFVFGDAGDQNVIKCGSYVGNGNANGPEINLGWEPQWVLIKNTTTAKPWCMHDMMRGFWNNGTSDDITLFPNLTNSDFAFGVGEFTSTGFKLRTSDTNWNKNDDKYIYMCIRRPDGYVGKPPELGTDVFAMDIGAGSSTIPNFDSSFPVDFTLLRAPASSTDWFTGARLLGNQTLKTNSNAAESAATAAYWRFDDNEGWNAYDGYNSSYQSWMWKRHAGFDVVAYTGNGVSGRQIRHSMNKTVEMLWIKTRDSTEHWIVGHKGLDGGSDPWDHEISLSDSGGEANNVNKWNDTAPTSTHFTLGNGDAVNKDGDDFIAMLFASVDGISKVGSYTGNATDSDTTSGTNTITFGFQPRMVIVKSYDSANTEWVILDTLRGWASGSNNTKRLRLNLTNAQNNEEIGYPTSTGMVLTGNGSGLTNNNGDNYIYYAHA